MLQFEDPTLLGFLATYDTASELLRDWRQAQDTFLRVHAKRLRRDPLKAWNIYGVLLSEGAPTSDELLLVMSIEEDLSATRKIARAGVSTKSTLLSALAPLLPLRGIVTDHASVDVLLRTRLAGNERQVFDMLQRPDFDVNEMASWLLRGLP